MNSYYELRMSLHLIRSIATLQAILTKRKVVKSQAPDQTSITIITQRIVFKSDLQIFIKQKDIQNMS